jgi:hypothetical protein
MRESLRERKITIIIRIQDIRGVARNLKAGLVPGKANIPL